jgi:glycosyltransferase involved in cell wall biosynthesis
MNIALIIGNYNYQGGGQVVANLAEHLQSLGHSTNVVAIRCSEGDFESRPSHFSNTVDLHASGLFSSVLKLIKIFRHSSYDVCISVGGYANLSAGLAKFSSRGAIRVIGSEHFAKSVLIGDYVKPVLRLSLPLFRLAYAQLNGLVFVSDRLRLEFLKKNSWHSSRCVTIYNPIRSIKKRLKGFVKHENVLGVTYLGVGVLEQRKRWDLFLEAFSIVANSSDRLLLAGTGSLKYELESLAIELGIESQVCFLGYVDNINSLMNKSDILVLTSDSEAFGMVLAEGLAAGLQVISTNSFSGPAEVLGNGRYGFLAEVDNVNSIISSMRAAIESPIPLEIIHEGASRFSVDCIVNNYLEFIETVVACDGCLNDAI